METDPKVIVKTPSKEKGLTGEDGAFFDLVTTDVFSWNWLSKHCSDDLNRIGRFSGNFCQLMFLFLITLLPVFIPVRCLVNLVNMKNQYGESSFWKKENCSMYYLFNFKNLSFYNVREEEINATNVSKDCRFHPIVDLVIPSSTAIVASLFWFGWFYSCDRKYGALKFWYENLTTKFRQKHPFIQLLISVTLIPANLFLCAITPHALTFLFMLIYSNLILKLFNPSKSKGKIYTITNEIDRYINIFINEPFSFRTIITLTDSENLIY